MVENQNYFLEKLKKGLQSENALGRYKTGEFIRIIADAEPIDKFDIDLYSKLVEKMIVFDGEKFIITFLDETEIECEIE